MPKDIAVVAYDTNPASAPDAVVIRDRLNASGYSAQLLHQWSFKETDPAQFRRAEQWERFDGVVICDFYVFWNLRELIRAGRPVICMNAGYVDDLGVGESRTESVSQDVFNVVNNTHPIITGSGLALGTFDIGNPVGLNSVSTFNHHVDVLITTLAGNAVLATHKTHPLTYFGWYRMSQASAGSKLLTLLLQTANWTFSGP
jgi:hypothetical protein